MPAASNKIESKTSPEVVDPTKQFLNLVDKKVRNIEKRKSKLDAVRSKQAAGETLEKEQKEAIKHYDAVIVNLEFARELQKNFNAVAADIEKQQKKQGKREKQEKAASELKRMTDVLLVKSTLDSLGSESVRQHFKTGKHGAVVLTEDNLTSLDELFQLISPSRDGEENFADSLSTAAEHLISLLEGRDRPVAGSTYKELLELIHLVDGCGYFERVRKTEEASAEPVEEVEEEEKEEKETPTPLAPTPSDTFNDVSEADLQNNATVQQSASDLEETSLSHSQVVPSVVTQEAPNSSFFTQTTTSTTPTAFQPSQTQPPPQPIPTTKTRPLPEIISSVRGTFSFLQDSEIEDTPHIDPAVVAAQPMMRPPSVNSQPPQTSLLPSGFPAAPMVDQSCDSEAQDALSLSQQSLTQSNLDFSGGSQSFAQAGLSHSQNLSGGVMADALIQAPVEDSAAPSQQHSSHGMMGQGRGAGEPAAQFDLPPSIPMPPSQSQQDVLQLAGQEKKFQLNASATEFQSRSMYPQMPPTLPNLSSQPPPTQPQPQPQPPTQTPTQTPSQPPSQPPHPPSNQTESRPLPPPTTVSSEFPSAPNFAQAAGDFSQAANSFQSGGFPRGGRGGGPGGYRGGQRGGRGGNNNGNAMQNGFNSRPQNGNSRPGNRGGASFQGFPPRSDYRPDSFQGYNSNGFGGSAPYQKRGGAGGPGFPRGGSNRGAGGMRGGPRGGGPPRGAGGNRGGMNRPSNQ